jgi:hypothetical protein
MFGELGGPNNITELGYFIPYKLIMFLWSVPSCVCHLSIAA